MMAVGLSNKKFTFQFFHGIHWKGNVLFPETNVFAFNFYMIKGQLEFETSKIR